MKRIRRENPDQYTAYEQSRYVGDRRERNLQAAKARRATPGPKRDAQTAVGNAVRDGRLIKPDACSQCSRTGIRLEGHHDDYGKPLEVIWLCARCHRRRHADMGTPP
jgi:hypothetical protein